MSDMKNWEEEDSSICLHRNEDNTKYFGAVTPPIVQTSLFTFKDYDSLIEALENDLSNYVYTRGVNPTTEILEKKLADLERGESCKCFASGIAAITSTFFSLTQKGDHILMINNIYGPAQFYVRELEKYGVEHSIIYIDDAEEIIPYIKENTKLIYIESPSTMKFDIVDIKRIAEIAKTRGILTAIDNTWATPLNQKPLTLGIDISLHSCSKFLGGHSDIVAGTVIGSKDIIHKIFEVGHQMGGATLSPFDAWLILRGMRTLRARLNEQQQSMKIIIDMLKQHPKVKCINHPLAWEGKKKELFDRQAIGYTSLFSIEIDCPEEKQMRTFMDSFKVFQLGVSWGGFESLVLNSRNTNQFTKEPLKGRLVRLYVGLEEVSILCKDLKNALDNLK